MSQNRLVVVRGPLTLSQRTIIPQQPLVPTDSTRYEFELTPEDVATVPHRVGIAISSRPDGLANFLQSNKSNSSCLWKRDATQEAPAPPFLVNLFNIHTIDSSELLRCGWGARSQMHGPSIVL